LPSYNCVLCNLNIEETLHHLFFDCPFAMSCWNFLCLTPFIQHDLVSTVPLFKQHISRPFFLEIIIAMFWAIWSACNDAIFINEAHSLQKCRFVLKNELARIKLRAKQSIAPQIQLWLDNFVSLSLFSLANGTFFLS